mgnify:CR=1 FL=1
MINTPDSTRYSFRRYVVDSSTERAQELINSIVSDVISKKETRQPIGELVANAVDSKVNSGVYFQRLLLGGKHDLENVIKNASCFDIAVFTEKVLTSLNVNSEKKTTRLLMIPKHYYTVLEDGSVIDLFLRGSKSSSGFFASEEEYLEKLGKINSLGFSIYSRQMRKVFLGKKQIK